MKFSRLFSFTPFCLFLVLGIQVVLSMEQTSITYDEFAHLPAGYSYLKTGDFRMYNHNPPLIKLIAALPLLFTEAQLPESSYWNSAEVVMRPWFYGTDFMRANRTQYLDLFFYARLMILFLSGFLGLLVFLWSRELYGTSAGYFSLFLYVFCPNILAQSGIATVDLGASLTFFLAVYCFYRYLKTSTSFNLFLSGTTLGLALLSKFTALLLFIIYPLILLAAGSGFLVRNFLQQATDRGLGTKLIHFLLITLIAFSIVNLGYAFQGSFSSLGTYNFTSNFLKPLNHPLLKDIPLPLPFYYLKGFDNQKVKEEHGSEVLLLGEVSKTGWWYYYLVVLLFKLPVPIFMFLVLSVVGRNTVTSPLESDTTDTKRWVMHNRPRTPNPGPFLLIPIWVILIIFSFIRLQLGIRYILPILPFLFVYLGQTIRFLSENKKINNGQQTIDNRRWTKILIFTLSLWYMASSIAAYPNYLSYFNELAGGPKNGYRILSDANLDIGQGLIQLKKYLTEQNIEKVNLLYFGWMDPSLYGIQAYQFPNLSPDGVYAISVVYLQGIPFIRMDNQKRIYQLPSEFFEIFKNLEPMERIAHSIFIYVIPKGSQ